MSRLECKAMQLLAFFHPIKIRICPDWNVKEKIPETTDSIDNIRICPDWNVKFKFAISIVPWLVLEYVQIGM